MKVEFEAKAFGTIEEVGCTDSYKSSELAQTKLISKDTTLGELEAMLVHLLSDVESGYSDPEQLLGKITIRVRKKDGELIYLG
ncbi:MAG TPA: hypothetical protein IAA29_13830 [Candidatus Paenibacillus intestinavium]|nr:hypothetical protein [Candidatus Paenibacillus intestinavium]